MSLTIDQSAATRHVIAADLIELAQPLDSLKLLPNNPRVGNVDVITKSFERFGQRKPVVVRRSDRVVIAGNHSVQAARNLGWDQIAVVFVDDDDATAQAFALADNRTAELGTYDDDALAAMIAAVADVDAELLDATGWSTANLDALLAKMSREASKSIAASDAPLFSDDEIIDAAVAHYFVAGFPYPSLPLHAQMQELNALALTETAALVESRAAYHVADSYNPHRFTTPVAGKRTALEAIKDDAALRHAMRLTIDNATKITDASLLSSLSFVRGTQVAAQFRPAFALYLYRRFAPTGGVVLDTSTGFGGRMLGFFASECSAYVGVDPEERTCAGNQRMSDALCPSSKSVELIELAAEDVPLAHVRGRCDFAFTSPPYFAKERYSDASTQSCVRYATAEAWRDGFLAPMMRLQFEALKPNSVNAVNIADVKISNKTIPLERWVVEAALAAGFAHDSTERFPLPRVPGQGEAQERFEPVFLFRKGSRST